MAQPSIQQDVAILDMPLSRKMFFGPSSDTPRLSTSRSSGPSALDSPSEDETSDPSFSGHGHDEREESLDTISENSPTRSYRLKPQTIARPPPHHPRFSRALSMPLPAQLSQLSHPYRHSPGHPLVSPGLPPEMARFRELSLELADSVQSVIQTMLQVSPPHILDPAKEQVSACSLSVPTPYMSAMFTAMKNLNYISANMSTFCPSIEPALSVTPPNAHCHFDIGELLQNVGDLLSGTAAQSGVELVLFHGDVALKHIWVQGDETGISYILSHIIRQILIVAQRGDSIEIGLIPIALAPREHVDSPRTTGENGYPLSTSPTEMDGPLQCTIEISHKFSAHGQTSVPRLLPQLSTKFLGGLLDNIGASLNAATSESQDDQHQIDVVFTLERGETPTATPAPAAMMNSTGERIDAEPTLEDLISFAEKLRGKKVTLHASSKRSFARHLTSYLTSWGMDVSHASAEEGVGGGVDSPVVEMNAVETPLPGLSPKSDTHPISLAASFVFIDDDIPVLKQQLDTLRAQPSHFRTRPSLPNRARSSSQIPRTRPQPVIIVHFTSISNFKLIKDAVQSVLASYGNAPFPEIMIIPKPAGPRRLLTALHTAVTKPILDPFFTPIATAPNSPGSYFGNSYISNSSPRPAYTSRPAGSRSNSDRSTSVREETQLPPPSPLSMADDGEYFSETSLGSTPSSGYLLQSPEGKRTGIFFHPNPKSKGGTARVTSFGHSMERDKGQIASSPTMPPPRPNGESSVSFSSFQASRSPNPTPLSLEYTRSASSSSTRSRMVPSPTALDNPLPSTSRRSSGDTARKSSLPSSPVMASSEQARPPAQRTPSRQTTGKTKATGSSFASKTSAKPNVEANIVPPISVLIVDDNPINQTVLSTFMKKKKIKYGVANDGQEAVNKWKAGEYHLILMDIQMPIMDGIEATKEIRRLESANANAGYPPASPSADGSESTTTESRNSASSPYRSSVIIVALTASSLQSDRVAALAAGCNDFLTKPVSLLWLNNKIIEWGSIKALQMWADPGPDLIRNQYANAKTIADRLHVPKERRNGSPVRSASRQPAQPPAPIEATTFTTPTSAVLLPPGSSTSSQFWSPGPSPPTFWGNMNGRTSPGNTAAPEGPVLALPTPEAIPSISTVLEKADQTVISLHHDEEPASVPGTLVGSDDRSEGDPVDPADNIALP